MGGGYLNKRRIGSEKERLACEYLEKKGYSIVTTNYWCRYADIDIVAKEADVLVFVEVKYRGNAHYGGSMGAVSQNKIRKISQCAVYYIFKEQIPPDTPMRFDVVAIDGTCVTHLENAFEVMGDF